MRFRGLAALPLLAAPCADPAAAQPTPAAEPGELDRPGLELVLRSRDNGATDARVARLPALYVPDGEPASPFLAPGPFEATFRGVIQLDLNDSFRFAVRGVGGVRLSIDGQVVLERDTLPTGGAAASTDSEVRLNKGPNPIELVYRGPARGDAWIRLAWSNDHLPEEPLPPGALRHAESAALDRGRSRRAARGLLADAMCVRCHEAPKDFAARAGAMPEATAAGPDLAGIGSRRRRTWIEQWLLDPRSLRPQARMPSVLSGDDGEAHRQAADLAAYLTTGADADRAAAPGPPPLAGAIPEGRRLYAEIGCAACHGDGTSPPRVDGAPRLIAASDVDTGEAPDPPMRLRDTWRPASLAAWLSAPTRFDPASRMPETALETDETAALAAYLLAAVPGDRTEPPPAPAEARRGNPERGRRLADALRCRACHSLPGGEPAASALPLKELAGRPAAWTTAADETARHPRYDFASPEVESIERLLAEDSGSLSRVVPIEYAERRIRQGGCLACHGRDGVPASWSPPGAAAATDAAEDPTLIFSLPSETENESGPDHAPPDLTWAGAKLRSDWLEDYLAGRLAARPRPHLRVRMPAFPRHADLLAAGLHHQHGLAQSPPDTEPADTQLAAVGRDLIRGDRLGCHACHALGDEPALGGAGSRETINFDLVRRRLRRAWFDRFLLDPQRLLPGTKMPRFVDEDGYTALHDVFDGQAARQFEAIWRYLGTID